MLVKQNRLRKNADVLRVLKEGKFVSGKMVRLKYLFRSQEFRSSEVQDGNSRFAVVCSKKVFKRAVDRNRAKRLVREALRLLIKDGKIKAGYDLVFLIQSGIEGKKMQEVKKDVEGVLRKAGLLSI